MKINTINLCCNEPFERKNNLTDVIHCLNCQRKFIETKNIKCKYCKLNNNFKKIIIYNIKNKKMFKCRYCSCISNYQELNKKNITNKIKFL